MDDPILTIEEREAINAGRWFSSLSPSLRHDILRCAYVKRLKDGDLISARGDPPEEWMARQLVRECAHPGRHRRRRHALHGAIDGRIPEERADAVVAWMLRSRTCHSRQA